MEARRAAPGDARGPALTDLFRFERLAVGTRIQNVSGAVPAAGITVVIGPSGSGKSTLLRCCNRLEAPSEGRVLFRGEDVAGLDIRAHRRRVGMVFQAPVAFPGSVLDNLRVADPAAAPALLEQVHLDPAMADRDAGTLSGGEAQRMVLARCLATRPEVLLLDEPTSALDGGATRRLEELAREVAAAGTPMVWVTHDLQQLQRLADHVVVLIGGRWVWDGPADGLAAAPADVVALLEEGGA